MLNQGRTLAPTSCWRSVRPSLIRATRSRVSTLFWIAAARRHQSDDSASDICGEQYFCEYCHARSPPSFNQNVWKSTEPNAKSWSKRARAGTRSGCCLIAAGGHYPDAYAGENGIEFDRPPIDPAPLREHAPRLQSATPSEYRHTCYSHRSISGAKTVSRPTTSDEQRRDRASASRRRNSPK